MTDIRPEWFNNNQAAIDLFFLAARLVDTVDNIIDKDKAVSDAEIIETYRICLYRLPLNPVYNALYLELAPMWQTIISAYETANQFERDKDEHGLEIAHILRYALGHMILRVIIFCVGEQKAQEYAPAFWKALVSERFDEYKKERMTWVAM